MCLAQRLNRRQKQMGVANDLASPRGGPVQQSYLLRFCSCDFTERDQIDDPAPAPTDNVVPFVTPTAQAEPEPDLNLMDQPIPPIGERKFTGECPGFLGRVGPDDNELAVLRAYTLDVVRQAGLSPDELRRTPKKFWMKHRNAKTVREIWDAR
jgi:hypothetical protein